MTSSEVGERAEQILSQYRLPKRPIYTIGTFDKGITVLSQQVRALNLAWALVESGQVALDFAPMSTDPPPGPDDADPGPNVAPDTARKSIAIVGAGFAGLTVAAGLLKKRANVDITVFERRDTVLPLQHGSDSRWLHPHIYDWPSRGSEAYSAALPVLNWTASRASDVVVQTLSAWREVAGTEQPAPEGTKSLPPTVTMFCNTRHIQVSCAPDQPTVNIEWIGEERKATDPAMRVTGRSTPAGASASFDLVVLALGFGLEDGARMSYWRNETLAQPHLGQARSTYIVSGSGDGAMIDLFRLRISHFRQDRILAELFAGRVDLLERLRAIQHSLPEGSTFDALGEVWDDAVLEASTAEVQGRLRASLRQDTNVLLRVRRPSFASLFDGKRVSFQNRLLAFLLYRCGAFTPVVAETEDDLERLADEHGVPDERIIVRHGTRTQAGLTEVLSAEMHKMVKKCFKKPSRYLQDDDPSWPGGYFDMPGVPEGPHEGTRTSHTVRGKWRREYLPSPMEAVAASFCASIAGYVASVSTPSERLRVVLHRTLLTGDEVVLQQCCDYAGVGVPADLKRVGRTFPSRNGTIGAAFSTGSSVRTRRGATREQLKTDMRGLALSEASQNMADDVASVVAIPLLGKPSKSPLAREQAPTAEPGVDGSRNVVGVLYLDSYDEDAFVNDEMMDRVIGMSQALLDALPALSHTAAKRIANTEFWRRDAAHQVRGPKVEPESWQALETVAKAPESAHLQHLNFDFSDFTPVEES